MGNTRTCTPTMLEKGNTAALIQIAITLQNEAAQTMAMQEVPAV